jgi:hypothetical protein
VHDVACSNDVRSWGSLETSAAAWALPASEPTSARAERVCARRGVLVMIDPLSPSVSTDPSIALVADLL